MFNWKISVRLARISRLLINASSYCHFLVLALQFEYACIILVRVLLHYFSFCLCRQIKHSWEHSQKLKSTDQKWLASRLSFLRVQNLEPEENNSWERINYFNTLSSKVWQNYQGYFQLAWTSWSLLWYQHSKSRKKVFTSLGWEGICWR